MPWPASFHYKNAHDSLVRANFPECTYTSPTSITGSEDLFRFINGTAASVPGIMVGKLKHWHCNDFRICYGFRIACETGYSLTEGAGSHAGFL